MKVASEVCNLPRLVKPWHCGRTSEHGIERRPGLSRTTRTRLGRLAEETGRLQGPMLGSRSPDAIRQKLTGPSEMKYIKKFSSPPLFVCPPTPPHTRCSLLVVAHVVDTFCSSSSPSTMPSLRRNFSSPLVRSSPYSSALNGAQVAGGRGHRRSSGSDTTTRRVLADIEWWRVTDGQCDPSVADQESEAPNRGDAQPVAAATPGVIFHDALIGVDHPSSILSLPWPAATPASTTEVCGVFPLSTLGPSAVR
jgi:hypothetical protein